MQGNSFQFLVLPSFEVKLTPSSPFFYVDSKELVIDIRTTYVKSFYFGVQALIVFQITYSLLP